MRPYIIEQRCDGCGECVTTCPYEVFLRSEEGVTVSVPEDCIECLTCIEVCPRGAVYMDD